MYHNKKTAHQHNASIAILVHIRGSFVSSAELFINLLEVKRIGKERKLYQFLTVSAIHAQRLRAIWGWNMIKVRLLNS